MAEIVPFAPPKTAGTDDGGASAPPPNAIWVCRCGCRTFELRADGSTICAACDTVTSHDGSWAMRPPFEEPQPAPKNMFHTVEFNENVQAGAPSAVRMRMAAHVANLQTTWVMCGDDAGAVHAWWSDREPSDAEKTWLRNRVIVGTQLLMDEPPVHPEHVDHAKTPDKTPDKTSDK